MKHQARAPGYDRTPCSACGRIYGLLYPKLKQIRADQQEILNHILDKQETEYLTAEQTMERVGISESTLLRCQHRGEITVAKIAHRKKYFRECDVERLRKEYWGRE